MKATTTKTYEQQVDEWVVGRAASAHSFEDLVRNLNGVFPSDVAASIQRLVPSHVQLSHVSPSNSRATLPDTHVFSRDWLPVPHPLDFDWRFHATSIQYLMDVLSAECGTLKRFCALGSPSIVPSLLDKFPTCEITVLDANPLVHEALKRNFPSVNSVTVDLTRGKLADLNSMDAMLVDPPWYEPQMRAFLWTASRLCHDNTKVLTSFPAMGTRANVSEQRDDLVAFAGDLGLELVGCNVGQLRYASPYFEQNAIKATGIGSVPIDWRAADLLIFNCRNQVNATRPEPVDAAEWIEVQMRGVRVKVKSQACRSCDPRLQSIVEGDVLNTVSQRDPRIKSVDVWTMGNRVFACENTEAFLKFASAWSERRPILNAVAA